VAVACPTFFFFWIAWPVEEAKMMTAIYNTETIAGRLPEFLNMSFSPGLLLEARKES